MQNSLDSDPRAFSPARMLVLLAPLAAVCLLGLWIYNRRISEGAQQRLEEQQQSMRAMFKLDAPGHHGLDSKFVDADNDLIADPPADPAKRISPDTIVFSYIAGPEAENELPDWKNFVAALEKSTGKKVETRIYESTEDQLKALAAGKLHVTGFNTGNVPEAVASSGFVPVCTFGRDDGSFGYTMELIVPAASKIKSLEDLKGHVITFTTSGSNSGCKAALALLQEHDMQPLRDYTWKFSGDHVDSIKGIAAGELEVAPVASDVLERTLDKGIVQRDAIRAIYKSERYPPATLGYAYNLSDDLAVKIRATLLEFDPKGTSLEKQMEAARATKFVPVSYKQDFALVRQIDAAFRRTTGN